MLNISVMNISVL